MLANILMALQSYLMVEVGLIVMEFVKTLVAILEMLFLRSRYIVSSRDEYQWISWRFLYSLGGGEGC